MTVNHKKFKIGLVVLMTMILIAACSFFTASAANNKELEIDVIFVIDGSSSMGNNDPNNLSRAASNLFVDMCEYDHARAGYVVYTQQIEVEYPLTELKDMGARQGLKDAINKSFYPKADGTDISRGLTRAMNILVNSDSIARDRSPMIILLSDGKIDYLADDRKNVYSQELKETLNNLAKNNIPVYTIGLGAGVDTALMQDVANKTNGLYNPANTATELPKILSDIMAHRLGSIIKPLGQLKGTGAAETIEFDIPSDDIHSANISILSTYGVSNISLKDEKGQDVPVPSSTVVKSRSNYYDLIKIMNPDKGTWKLTFTGANQDDITILLVTSYDRTFELSAKEKVNNGSPITFTVTNVGDPDAFIGAECDLKMVNTVTGDVYTKDSLRNTGSSFEGPYTFPKAGTYKVTGTVIGDGFTRPTNQISVEVVPETIKLINNENGTDDFCLTPFLGLGIMNTVELPMSEIVTCDKDAELSVEVARGGWEEAVTYTFDEKTDTLVITGVNGGKAVLDIQIIDNFGQSQSYTVSVSVIPSWIPFLVILVLIGIIVALVFIIIKAKQPRIKGKLKISVTLPSELAHMTPPEAEIDLSILNKKGKVGFMAVLASNLTLGGMYTQALEGIMAFTQKLMLEAANSDCSSLWLYIPAPDNGVSLQFNNAPVDKKVKKSINSGMPATINYSTFSGSYVITLNFGENSWGGDDMFGSTGGGFGGFGGDGSGFGGFGGNDNAGFGGGFGGNNNAGFGGNDNQGFGGFGGGNDNSGFGGFGGGNDNNTFNAF